MVAMSDLGRGGGRLKAGGMLDVNLHISSTINDQMNLALLLFSGRFCCHGSTEKVLQFC